MPQAMALRFGYNTNGFAHHRLTDAIEVLAELGYDGIALTVDWHHLDPFRVSTAELDALGARLRSARLAVVIETGARYILDRWRRHEPSLVSAEGRERRFEFLVRAIDIAQRLGAEAVSFFSGRVPEGVPPSRARDWFMESCARLARHAERGGVQLALEPEPGMLVESLASARRVLEDVASPCLGLALDVGHVRCSEAFSEVEAIERYARWVRTVHIEDIAGREHVHRMFGDGDIVFEPILEALTGVRFGGLVSVELSRDSHRAPEVAAAALNFLRRRTPVAIDTATPVGSRR
jgi:sugar phosphate isomerase/epimerase